MRRRTVLALLGSSVATAGCAGRFSPPVASAADESPSTNDDDAGDCPSFERDADRTVCERTPGTVSLVSEASVFRIDPDDDAVESFRLTLSNDADTAFAFGPTDWTLYRWTDRPDEPAQWTVVESGPPNLLLGVVDPGGSYDYLLSPAARPSAKDDARTVVADLEPGRYAFALAGGLRADGADGGGESGPLVECVATFRVEHR
jgi:hypothetical protein